MNPRKFAFAAGMATAALLLALAAPAGATYSNDGGATVSNPSPSAGSTVTIDSSGWQPNSSVTITLHSTPVVLATVTSDSTGAVHATVTIPSSTASGAHTIELTGTDSAGAPRTVSTAVTVGSGGGSSLPRTGAAIASLLLIGAALFGIGLALSAARKRAVN